MNCEICAIARSHGGPGERAVALRTCVSARLFSSCCSRFLPWCLFRDGNWGKGGDFSQDKSSKPCVCLCLCVPLWDRMRVQHSSKAGFHTIHTNSIALIYKSARERKCEPIISAAKQALIANCSKIRQPGLTDNYNRGSHYKS